jgi:hypothetical protein
MVNPSLKAQIEAAKSALASDLALPSLVVPPPKPSTTPIMVSNDIDNGTGVTAATDIPADGKSVYATDAAALDERITRLEAKLFDSQRDLHTLLQRIRAVSRMQANSGQTHENSANDQVDAMVTDEAGDKDLRRRNQRSPVMMIAMAALTGLAAGIAYFLVTHEGGSSALAIPNWISIIIDSFNS